MGKCLVRTCSHTDTCTQKWDSVGLPARVRDAGGPAMRKDIDGDEFAPDIERGIPRGGQPETLPHFSEVVVSSC